MLTVVHKRATLVYLIHVHFSLQTLRQENAALTQEMKVTKEKAMTVQAPPAANGDIHIETKSVIAITEHERM